MRVTPWLAIASPWREKFAPPPSSAVRLGTPSAWAAADSVTGPPPPAPSLIEPIGAPENSRHLLAKCTGHVQQPVHLV